ncbi:MAG: hypothetical protein OES19_05080 [Nitrosopumilus sp.]|nr:hypothetical protein [Nitrosopumilus sp.]
MSISVVHRKFNNCYLNVRYKVKITIWATVRTKAIFKILRVFLMKKLSIFMSELIFRSDVHSVLVLGTNH